jgi:Ca-activated chloride channel family protein
MHWAAPEYAWLILLAIPAGLLLRWAAVRRRHAMSRLLGAGPARPGRLRQLPAGLPAAFAFLLIVAALCRPQWGLETLPRQSRGLDILVALDVSRSMLADDQFPTRLAVAKQAIGGLLARLQGDRIGLIAFAGSAFLVCPLTSDYATFAQVLAETGGARIPLGGTSLAAPLAEARRAYAGSAGRGRFLIVISDGEDQGRDAAAAAQALRDAGVAIYSVAAGTVAGGLIPLPGGEFLRDRQGAIVRSRMHPEELRRLAGDGRLRDLASDSRALETLYAAELSGKEKRLVQGTRQHLADRYQYPLALALVLLLLEPFLAARAEA